MELFIIHRLSTSLELFAPAEEFHPINNKQQAESILSIERISWAAGASAEEKGFRKHVCLSISTVDMEAGDELCNNFLVKGFFGCYVGSSSKMLSQFACCRLHSDFVFIASEKKSFSYLIRARKKENEYREETTFYSLSIARVKPTCWNSHSLVIGHNWLINRFHQ